MTCFTSYLVQVYQTTLQPHRLFATRWFKALERRRSSTGYTRVLYIRSNIHLGRSFNSKYVHSHTTLLSRVERKLMPNF
jgi:hypothetical protein